LKPFNATSNDAYIRNLQRINRPRTVTTDTRVQKPVVASTAFIRRRHSDRIQSDSGREDDDLLEEDSMTAENTRGDGTAIDYYLEE
jgi:hypothetical protein